jgi:ABC-type transporter Mla MlaB component
VRRKQSKRGRLVLEGAATIRSADAVHARLSDCLQRHSDVEIDCAGVTEADLSLVQLLLATRRSAERAGKTVALSAPAAGPLRQALAEGGLLPTVAGQPGSEDAFWRGGKPGQ